MSNAYLAVAQGSWITYLSRGTGCNQLNRMRPDGSGLATIFGGELEDVPGLSGGQVLYRDPHWTRQSPDRAFFLSWAHDASPSSEWFACRRRDFGSEVGFLKSRGFHDAVLGSGLQVLIAVDRNDDDPWLTWLLEGVMAAPSSNQDPPVSL